MSVDTFLGTVIHKVRSSCEQKYLFYCEKKKIPLFFLLLAKVRCEFEFKVRRIARKAITFLATNGNYAKSRN